MKKTSLAVAVALLAPIPLASTAFADRPPTASERQKLTKILRSNGFVSWKKIEREIRRLAARGTRGTLSPSGLVEDSRTPAEGAQPKYSMQIELI